MARLKAFCELYERSTPQLQSAIPSIMFGGMGGRWRSRYDYVLCSRVLARGYGKWELICRRPEQWDESAAATFPQLLSEATGTEVDLKGCCEFLHLRLEEIADHIEKTAA